LVNAVVEPGTVVVPAKEGGSDADIVIDVDVDVEVG
jgi:hypothetical protein